MQNNLDKIQEYIDDSFTFAENKQFDVAIEHFFCLRMLLRTSIVDGRTSKQMVASDTKVFENEAKEFNQRIAENNTKHSKQEILIIGDSLQLPRPDEKKLDNGGMNLTTSFMLQKLIENSDIDFSVNTWGQRFYTTTSILDNWEAIVPANLEDTHLVIHVGLNDYVERMFLEEERLAMDLYPEEIKNKIIDFARIYRREIVERQLNHSYVPIEKFKVNLVEIISKAKQMKAKSINLVNIISFPPLTWSSTPRCMWNTSRFNMHLYQLEQENSINVIDLDRLVWYSGINDTLLPDKMHLSQKGHKLLSDEIFKVIEV